MIDNFVKENIGWNSIRKELIKKSLKHPPLKRQIENDLIDRISLSYPTIEKWRNKE